jgi:ribonuclease VapC
MVVDTSALVAILFDESDAKRLAESIVRSEVKLLSAASYLETCVVVDNKRGAEATLDVDDLVDRTGVSIEPFTQSQAVVARRAYQLYGKGHHPAGLNFGDCFAYALAKTTGEPLLFKGDDFARTDATPAL